MKSFFDEQAYAELNDRLNKLTPDTDAQWGKMNPAQMMKHCQYAIEVPLEKSHMPRPNALMRFAFKFFRASMTNDKLWKPGLPTVKSFVVKDTHDFDQEKQALLSLMNEFYARREGAALPDHPAFGKFSREEWGKLHYKHLDHHLRQFGV